MSKLNSIRRSEKTTGEIRSLIARFRCLSVSREQGSAMVETALVLPVICLLMTGIFSFSIALYQKLELAHGVASGARFLSTDKADTDPCSAAVSKIYASAPTLAQASITTTFVLDGTTYSGKTCSGTTHLVSGKNAQITATYPCSLTAYGKSFGTCTIAESITEVVQ